MRRTPRTPPASTLRSGLRRCAAFALAVVTAWGAQAADGVAAPTARQPADPVLPVLGDAPRLPNPYRGRSDLLAAGEAAYQKNCAVCHGESSSRPIAEGPDLRRLNSFCKTLADGALRDHCLRDVDTYFLHSVREGKLRAGLLHMPAWKDSLPQETIWAIRSYTESRALPPPRTLPDLPPVAPQATR